VTASFLPGALAGPQFSPVVFGLFLLIFRSRGAH